MAVRSLAWTVYSLALMAVLVPSSVYALFSDRAEASEGRASLRMSSSTDELVTFCDILSVSASSLVCFLQVAFSQNSLFHLLDQLRQVS